MLNALQLVSLSDFMLAAFCLFLAGGLLNSMKSLISRVGMLSYSLLFAGMAAFMGGVDHGFFQPINQRYIPTTLTYIFIAAATFMLFRYTILTFFKDKTAQILRLVAFIQLTGFVAASFYYHNFILVVGNYSPILLLFFIMNVIHIKRSSSELDFTLFCAVMIIATLFQILQISVSPLINGNTMYHLIAFIGYYFLYRGVKRIPDEFN